MSVWAAARKGDLDGVKAAVENGADIEERRGWSELKTVRRMVGKQGKLKATITMEYHNGDTPLHLASYNGHTSVADYLIERGVEVNSRNEDGWLPIHYACQESHLDTVQLLINKGSDFTSANYKGDTPLDLASQNRDTSVANYLMQRAAEAAGN